MEYYFDFVALDIETTDLDFTEDDIIEIAAVRFLEGRKGKHYSVLVKPHRKVPEFIKHLTHITDKELDSGQKPAVALQGLLNFIGSEEIIVCHNCEFDIGFINTKLEKYGFSPLLNIRLDTLELSRIYLPFIRDHRLETVSEYFSLELEQAHRALNDAGVTGEVLVRLLHFMNEAVPLALNHRIHQIALYAGLSVVPAVEKVLEFQRRHALLSRKKPSLEIRDRNYLEHKPAVIEIVDIDRVFMDKGIFSKSFPHYEIRKGQIEMANSVLQVFENDEFLLIEAGTGVGKSLAYLVPAVIYTYAHNTRVIISTNTKNLQEQLFYKDLPAVSDSIAIPFRATLLKGRRNYLCMKRWEDQAFDFENQLSPREAALFINLVVWQEFTRTGDISENSSFDPVRDNYIWKRVSSDSLFCSGKKCQFADRCYLMDVRKKADNSSLVIINHHLLLADMKTENSTLGAYENLVIDEAHNLPHLAPNELGLNFSYADFANFFSQMFNIHGKYQAGLLVKLKADAVKSSFVQQEYLIKKVEGIIGLLEENKHLFADFFSRVGKSVKENGQYGKLRIRAEDDFGFITEFLGVAIIFLRQFAEEVMTVKNILSGVSGALFVEYDRDMESLESALQQLGEYQEGLSTLYNADLRNFAYWMENIETNDPAYPGGILNYAPLNINQIMNDLLYSKLKTVVFTSATLAIRGIFKYFANRMGLDLMEAGFVHEQVVDSPFDYRKQSLVIVAGYLPDPADRYFPAQGVSLIRNCLQVARTGTMILFTAYKDLNQVFDELSEELYAEGISVFAQGKGINRTVMLREFKDDRKAVLLGTSSFWEGVDIPGESLSLLILYKLPFMVPTDPVVEAFLEKLKIEGLDSFMHYMLPNALLKYRQGYGRLIRNKTDRGVVIVLDSRIQTKKYGGYFQEIIPSNTVIASSPIEIQDILGQWFRR
ncbi:MAG: DEAD/DEAH box helicase family protein [Candidatus Cloacimonetes bacterium]|nr:DEAD/DEAH box helicase family protein [Candidatus Cloacimonadota bacterium]